MAVPTRLFPHLFKQSDAAKAMMEVFDTSDGKLKDIMRFLHLSSVEKKFLLQLWLQVDSDRNNKMDFGEFTEYFNLSKDVWVRRTFDIMNQSLTGVVSFVEFLEFCSKYLIIDKASVIEFSFRILSRRGSTFNLKHKPILDINDLKHFISLVYPGNSLSKLKKKAMDIFTVINKNGDGGAEFEEFFQFSLKNAVFIKFANRVLHHLRDVIFGSNFWVQRSRKIKLDSVSTIERLLFQNQVNRDSEIFFNTYLDEALIDGKGRPSPSTAPHQPNSSLVRFEYGSFYGGTYDEDFRDILLTKELRRGKIKSQATSDPYTLLEKAVAATDIASAPQSPRVEIDEEHYRSIISSTSLSVADSSDRAYCDEFVDQYCTTHRRKVFTANRCQELNSLVYLALQENGIGQPNKITLSSLK